MLLTVSIAVALWIVGTSIVHGLFALVYSSLLFRSHRIHAARSHSTPYLPKAAVILAVRGSDPFLVENMAALMQQDYPSFKLFIIVDSEQDAAWPDVLKLQSMAPQHVVTSALQDHRPTCSLKCSSLAEAVEQLDPSYEVIAFLDGDAPPHYRWLRELVEPLADKSIGVTTGNRWYTPSKISLGSMVRYFWNAGAIVHVWFSGIIWAGSMAMRREVVGQIDLVTHWRKSLSVDGTVVRQVRAAGLKTRFVPSVIMPNREDITLGSFTPWSERQLVAARSTGSGWAGVLFHALSIAVCVFAPILIILAGIALADQRTVQFGLLALGSYWFGAVVSSLVIELGMQSVLHRNRASVAWWNPKAALYYLPALVLSHFVYFKALTGATIRSRVSWRGVEYEISSDNAIQMIEYRPYVVQCSQQNFESIV